MSQTFYLSCLSFLEHFGEVIMYNFHHGLGDNSSLRATQIFMGILLVCAVCLDLIDVYRLGLSPNALSNFACSGFRLMGLSKALLPAQLTLFVQDQCSVQAREPAISIIFLTFKIALALIGAAYYLLHVVPSHFNLIKAKMLHNIANKGGLSGALKELSPPLFGLFALCGYFAIGISKSPSHFKTDLFSKMNEDLAAVVLLCAALMFINAVFLIILGFCRQRHL